MTPHATGGPEGTIGWLSFDDDDGDRWMFETSFLLSNWTCVFGTTCQGVTNNPELGRIQGCCSHGVHLADADDRLIVEAATARLTPQFWQNAAEAPEISDVFTVNDEGETLTRTHNGACIFLNGPDHPTGPGCALHFAKAELGGSHPDWKPAACWQLPVRLEEVTEGERRQLFILRRWERGDWGPAGADFDWWCTEDTGAFVGDEPVYLALADELIALIGEDIYDALRASLDSVRAEQQQSGRSTPVTLTSTGDKR